MKRSPAIRERHEFPHLSSMPWRRLPGSSSTPWLGFDPELQSDCSAAYRAFRLVMLALFALLGASSRVQAQSSNQPESDSLETRLEAQEQQITELKTLVLRQAQQLQSPQRILNELRKDQGTMLPIRSIAEDKRESAHLTVNRAHAPPPATNLSNESGSVQPVRAAEPNPQPESLQSSTPPSSPLQFRLGEAYLTPFGFVDFTSVWRNHDTGNGIATSFGSIPYGANTYQNHLSELRFSSQYSRIGFRVDALVKGMHLIGHVEADFLGSTPGNVAVSTNSNTLRSRLLFADLRSQRWEILAGQSWSLLTPGRSGISPLPHNVFYTQNADADYQAGLVFARLPELRFVYYPGEKVALAVALDSPEQYMGGSGGGGKITLPAALAPVYAGGELNDGSSGLHTPNRVPDVVAKLALDPSSRFHFEMGGVLRQFRLYNPQADNHYSATGGGGFLNARFGLANGLNLLTNNFWSDGGGRYIFGQVPDLIVRPDGSPSPIHAGSTVDGLEYKHGGCLLYGYYGGIYAQRNVAADVDGSPIGYGYVGSPASQNRAIQEATAGFSRSLWKNPHYGGLSLLGQYSYLTRSPWSVAPGEPPNANVHMVFMTLRFSLPGAAPSLRY